jgi:hypothetical protein
MIVFDLPLPYHGLCLSGKRAELRWTWNRPRVWARRTKGRGC